MRIMTAAQEALLSKLVDLAEGDTRLVEDALSAAPLDDDGTPDLERVLEYIFTHVQSGDHRRKTATG